MGPIAQAVTQATAEGVPNHWANRMNYETRLHSAMVENRICAGESSNARSELRDVIRTDAVVRYGTGKDFTLYRSR